MAGARFLSSAPVLQGATNQLVDVAFILQGSYMSYGLNLGK